MKNDSYAKSKGQNAKIVLTFKKILFVLLAVIVLSAFPSLKANAEDYSKYTPVSDKYEFAAMANNPSGKYYLTDDIIFEDTDFKYRGDFYNSGEYYIAMDTFSGILDGCGHSIVGLKGNNAIAIANKGTIKNLCIEECEFTSGTLCEENYGTVTNCKLLNSSANGIVYLNKNKVSYCFSKDSNCGICIYNEKNVSYCINYSDIESGTRLEWDTRNHVGGIACINEGTISCCGNFGNISNYDRAAGICSNGCLLCDTGTVEKCYNYGNITGDCAAGIACEDNNVYECINYGEINNSYAAGILINSYDNDVINCVNLGSVYIGDGYPICLGECVDSYYLEGVGDSNDEGIMLTAQEALNQASFSQLDFKNTWKMTENGIRLQIEDEKNTGLFFYTLPKTYYYKGEALDTTGLVILCFNNLGDWEFVDDYEVSGFTGEFGVNTITVYALGLTAEYDVTVNGWYTDSAGNRYYYKNGEKVKGFQAIDGQRYYFNARCIMQKGWQKISGYKYYFNSNGIMLTGWQTLKGEDGISHKYYFGANGVMRTLWQSIKNSKGVAYKYYFGDDGAMRTGWQSINNSKGVPYKYYFGSNGVMRTGWQSIKNSKGVAYKYYFGDNGYMRTGWQSIKNSKGVAYKYYFGGNGAMRTGWQKIANSKGVKYTYYFHTNGVMLTGWQSIKNANGVAYKYYFHTNGVMIANRPAYKIGSYFYAFDKYGRWMNTKTGFVKNVQYYYLVKGKAVTGWQTINGYKYYFSPKDAQMYYGGVYEIGSNFYLFNKNGTLCGNRWLKQDGYYFYFKNGKMVRGWQKINGKTYYFNDSMYCNGWYYINGSPYYFNKNGTFNELETATAYL